MKEEAKKEERAEFYEFGIFAEEVAATEYLKEGYTILERRWKMGHTEIDLILQKGDIIVISEVKARSGKDEDAISAVTKDKRKRMVRAADNYLRNLNGSYDYRFDIVAVTGNKNKYTIDFYQDAFVAADLF